MHLLPQYPVACRILGCTAQKEIDPKETAKNNPKTLQPVFSLDFEADSETLLKSFVFLKRLLQNIQPSKKTKMSILLNNMKKFLNVLGLSHETNLCVNEFWSNLFHTYF